VTELHKSTSDLPELKRKSLAKSISSSLIHRGLSPRTDTPTELPISAGHTPRYLDECPLPPPPPTTEKMVLSKEEKRKSWKNQLSKKSSEIHTRSLNNSNGRIKSDLHVPPILTNPPAKTSQPLTQNSKPKSDLQVPAITTTNQVCVDQKETLKKTKSRSIKKGKENLINVNNS